MNDHWERLVSAYEQIAEAPEPVLGASTRDWFRAAWPQVRDDLAQASGEQTLAAVEALTPFLIGVADWAALAEVCRLAREHTTADGDLAGHLRVTQNLGIARHRPASPGVARQHLGDTAGGVLAFA